MEVVVMLEPDLIQLSLSQGQLFLHSEQVIPHDWLRNAGSGISHVVAHPVVTEPRGTQLVLVEPHNASNRLLTSSAQTLLLGTGVHHKVDSVRPRGNLRSSEITPHNQTELSIFPTGDLVSPELRSWAVNKLKQLNQILSKGRLLSLSQLKVVHRNSSHLHNFYKFKLDDKCAKF